MLLGLGSAFSIAAAAYSLYWFGYGQYFQSTDDAYVSGNLVQLMPQVSGNVESVFADETDRVQAGETLVSLDPTDSRIALSKAENDLAETVRRVKQLYDAASELGAEVKTRQAEYDKAKADLERRRSLIGANAVSKEELQHAQNGFDAAKAALDAANHRHASSLAAVANTTLNTHPAVLAAETRLKEAWLAWKRTTIASPASGFVAKRSVQVGERIAPGNSLMVIVPLDRIWIDANFKEDQLRRIRIGQPVKLTSDLYGKKTVFHGRVQGIGAGTGSVFSLLPPQNATGNWIKVVQRLPVRIALDPKEIEAHPLRIGLSMIATVDTHDESGPVLKSTPGESATDSTGIYDGGQEEADRIISRILRENG